MKHYKASFKGTKSLDEIHGAVGRDGGMIDRVHSEGGETHVYFSGGEGHGKNLAPLGAGEPREVSEDEVQKFG